MTRPDDTDPIERIKAMLGGNLVRHDGTLPPWVRMVIAMLDALKADRDDPFPPGAERLARIEANARRACHGYETQHDYAMRAWCERYDAMRDAWMSAGAKPVVTVERDEAPEEISCPVITNLLRRCSAALASVEGIPTEALEAGALGRLLEAARQLSGLVANPEPGLFTWQDFLKQDIRSLTEAYDALMPKPTESR